MKTLLAVLAVLAFTGPAFADSTIEAPYGVAAEDVRTERVTLTDGISAAADAEATTSNLGGSTAADEFQAP